MFCADLITIIGNFLIICLLYSKNEYFVRKKHFFNGVFPIAGFVAFLI